MRWEVFPTWAHAEHLVEVSADAHLLVELGGLGQIGAGLEVGHREHVGATLAGRCGNGRHTYTHTTFNLHNVCVD